LIQSGATLGILGLPSIVLFQHTARTVAIEPALCDSIFTQPTIYAKQQYKPSINTICNQASKKLPQLSCVHQIWWLAPLITKFGGCHL
jgi:hypothetical protein